MEMTQVSDRLHSKRACRPLRKQGLVSILKGRSGRALYRITSELARLRKSRRRMAAASQTAMDAVTAKAAAAAPCTAPARALGNHQTVDQSSSSAVVRRYVPSTMLYHLHPIFAGPKRVKRGELDTHLRVFIVIQSDHVNRTSAIHYVAHLHASLLFFS
eukprot:6202088-Pleurochrysis_carterae.AAC.1